MPQLPPARIVGRRTAISFPLAFVVVWLAYRMLLGTRADDAYGPYHNDVFWPADAYLASADAGVLLPIFGHVMITLVGGAFLLLAIGGICRLIRRPAIAATLAPFVLGVLFCYSFLFVRAIPDQITVIDREARELRVRTFGRLTQLPDSVRTIAGRDVKTLAAKVGTSGSHSPTTVVRIYAMVAERELVYLGMRECPGSKTECAAVADALIAALASDLGRTLGDPQAGLTLRGFPLR